MLADANGELTRGIEIVEFACGIPQLLKGQHSDNVGGGIDNWSLRQPLGVCAGITPFNFPGDGADVDVSDRDRVRQHVRAEAERARSEHVARSSRELLERRRAAARRAQRRARRQGSRRRAARSTPTSRPSASSARRRSPSTSMREGTRHGKRVQALGGAKNHLVVMPDADLDQAADALVGAGYGSAGERCMAISVAVAVGDIADELDREARARESRS